MPRMDFEAFKAWAVESIKNYLPDSYRDADIDVSTVVKTGASYTAMMVRHEGQMTAPAINLEEHYAAYLSGIKLHIIGSQMAAIAQAEMPDFNLQMFDNYASIKDKLFIRVCNAYENREMLENVPHLRINDLVMTYHILVNESHETIASATVTNDMMEFMGIDNQTLREDAIANSEKIFPARVSPMISIMQDLTGIEMERSPMDNSMVIVTNSIGVNGAAALFYPQVREEVSALLHGDYYVLPSSIHEIIAIPVSMTEGYKKLESMVSQINRMQVAKEEQLSDRVYRYEAKTHKLELAADQESRLRKEKHKAKENER